MQRLSGLDATFLYLESSSNLMHVASTAIFDPSTVPGGYSFDKVKELVASRLHLLPPFRRRLVEVPFQLHHPLWVEDPDFDLDYHMRRAALPAPGGEEELAEFAADVMGRPLDRSKPLWEMYVVEGLENGLIATVTKTHHAAIDGVSGNELTVNLLDLTPEPAEIVARHRVEARPRCRPTSSSSAYALELARPPARPRRQGRPAHRSRPRSPCAAATAGPRSRRPRRPSPPPGRRSTGPSPVAASSPSPRSPSTT